MAEMTSRRLDQLRSSRTTVRLQVTKARHGLAVRFKSVRDNGWSPPSMWLVMQMSSCHDESAIGVEANRGINNSGADRSR